MKRKAFLLCGVAASALVLLPLLPTPTHAAWPVQYGNSTYNYGSSVATDTNGNVFAGGFTLGGINGQSSLGDYDGYVAKFNSSGTLQWTNLFGTTVNDYVSGVTGVGASSVAAAGYTLGALPGYTKAGNNDAMARLYDSAGGTTWTRQWGTAGDDFVQAVAADGAGHLYIGGTTSGSFSGYTNAGTSDLFVTQLNAATGAVNWTFQFGSNSADNGYGIAADSVGNVYLGGSTAGTLPAQTSSGDRDAFVLKLNVNGTLQWTRQFGSSAFDQINGLAVDSTGAVLLAGETLGTLSGQTSAGTGSTDAFVQKLDASGNVLWTRQFGTVGVDAAIGVAVNGADQAIVGGFTTGAFAGETNAGSYDAFVRVFSAAGGVDFTDQFGGPGDDNSQSVAVDTLGHVYLAGSTNGNLPGQTSAGSADAILIQTVPEPTTAALLALGLLPLTARRRRGR